MFRIKGVLTVLFFLLLIPLSNAQSDTGGVGLNVITGGAVGTEIEGQDVAASEPDDNPEEIEIKRESKGLAVFTGNAVNDESMEDYMGASLPVLGIVMMILAIGYFLYKKNKHSQ